MQIYCQIIGILLIFSGIFLLANRLLFIAKAQTVTAKVVAKVFRNATTETRTSRVKVLKLQFYNPDSGSRG